MTAVVALLAAVGSATIAHADVDYPFQSPSGNIACDLYSTYTGGAFVYCIAHDHTWTSAQPSSPCPGGHSPETLVLNQGNPPGMTCHAAPHATDLPTLDYGQTRSVAAVTCLSEQDGVTCTDSSTGHFFRLSRDSYELG